MGQQKTATYVRFERCQQDRVSKEMGPFPFVQLTYDLLRVGPEGEEIASFTSGFWTRVGYAEEPWSDVIIYAKEG